MPNIKPINSAQKIALAWEFKRDVGRWPNVGELDQIDMGLRADVLAVQEVVEYFYDTDNNILEIRRINKQLED